MTKDELTWMTHEDWILVRDIVWKHYELPRHMRHKNIKNTHVDIKGLRYRRYPETAFEMTRYKVWLLTPWYQRNIDVTALRGPWEEGHRDLLQKQYDDVMASWMVAQHLEGLAKRNEEAMAAVLYETMKKLNDKS